MKNDELKSGDLVEFTANMPESTLLSGYYKTPRVGVVFGLLSDSVGIFDPVMGSYLFARRENVKALATNTYELATEKRPELYRGYQVIHTPESKINDIVDFYGKPCKRLCTLHFNSLGTHHTFYMITSAEGDPNPCFIPSECLI